MKTREWFGTWDKSDWGDGAWQSEPDKVQWRDEATGAPCLALRAEVTGAWCGYVGIPKGHRVRPYLFESSHQVETRVIKKIVAAAKAKAEAKAARIKDPSLANLTRLSSGLSDYRARTRGQPETEDIGRYVECHGGVTFVGEGWIGLDSFSVFERCRTVLLPQQKLRAIGYPQGDAQQWIDEWEPLLGDSSQSDYEAWRGRVHAISRSVIREPGDFDRLRFVGFDCAHSGDISPRMDSMLDKIRKRSAMPEFDEIEKKLKGMGLPWQDTYRELAYVRAEVSSLAAQLWALGPRRGWVERY